MKSFNRLIILSVVLAAVVFLCANIVFFSRKNEKDNLYKVELSRVEKSLEEEGKADLSNCETITGVYTEDEGDIYSGDETYVIREINGKLYRIEYTRKDNAGSDTRSLVIMNCGIGAAFVILFGVLIYIRQKVIKPFNEISELPQELAKGTIAKLPEEQKSRYFGKFTWGLNMLGEELEVTKRNELELAKREKTHLLSLSHDIKTPLSAIKLYSRALSRGLYTDEKKLKETADNIDARANEIEEYVQKIIRSSEDSIFTFEASCREFYLSEVMDKLEGFYRDQLELLGTELIIPGYADCLLNADPDKLLEVLQNVFENAIKYGDGRRIELSFSDEENCRLITVSNTGCELSETELPHIFDSFWRGSNTGSKPGSGLGLFICRSLMNAMGGEIFAEESDGEMRMTVVCKKA